MKQQTFPLLSSLSGFCAVVITGHSHRKKNQRKEAAVWAWPLVPACELSIAPATLAIGRYSRERQQRPPKKGDDSQSISNAGKGNPLGRIPASRSMGRGSWDLAQLHKKTVSAIMASPNTSIEPHTSQHIMTSLWQTLWSDRNSLRLAQNLIIRLRAGPWFWGIKLILITLIGKGKGDRHQLLLFQITRPNPVRKNAQKTFLLFLTGRFK